MVFDLVILDTFELARELDTCGSSVSLLGVAWLCQDMKHIACWFSLMDGCHLPASTFATDLTN
jgi:hypothetical protein